MKVLFLSHDASRTGAPILLLSFLRWLRRHGGVDFEVLLLHDGPLRQEFEAIGPTMLAAHFIGGRATLSGRIRTRLLGWTNERWIETTIRRFIRRRRYDCIYGNSVVSLPWLQAFKRLTDTPCICHLHEMVWGIERSLTAAQIQTGLASLDMVVACSAAVERDLRLLLGVTSPIRVANAFVDPDAPVVRSSEAIRNELGLPQAAFLIGGVGRAEFRKGVDLLILLLRRLLDLAPEIDFRAVWVGHSRGDESMTMCRHDLRKIGMRERFAFVEQTLHPNDYIQAFDCFAMVSREDPMPLVALAAASLERPIVTFNGSGGIAEVVADGCGYAVPYLDLEAMAQAVLRIHGNRDEASGFGRAARKKVQREYSLDAVAPALRDAILEVGKLAETPSTFR